ncbi:pantoate--beta-alanine ligase [Paenibacillus koleovorans]|uniref:pantoate--beta-alanine ligase n=1 Tax=Paenibacillus koleovorans TaxID=121608 RepID=UPI000FD8D146|nr:pantoate--beta-alanine ligase [Paenibacillus koleovorans]
MQALTTIAALREAVQAAKRAKRRAAASDAYEPTVGFMPTLGYMHAGHVSLIERARQENDIVVVSIFVNPLQFGANEDFDKYPRDNERDTRLAKEAGADFVFIPSVDEMYPAPTKTIVSVQDITDVLCGASRPGHFDGVATVVAKLFNIVLPDKAYFGMKDAQQVAVIEQFTADLNLPVTIVPCPTFREPDGLAMSSRNVYLNADERRQATVLNEALRLAESLSADPEGITPGQLRERIMEHIQTAPLAVIDYVEIKAYPSMEEVSSLQDSGRILIALAVKFGKTRLIDNTLLHRG